MSDSPTPNFSFEARDVILNMALMESLGFGIYTAIFWFTMYMLVFHKRAKRTPRGMSTYLIIIPLYVLAMIHLSTRWVATRLAFVVHGETADSVLSGFRNQPNWCHSLSVISFSLMTLIADYVTVWRCWVIWGKNWKVTAVPFLLVFAGTAFCIMAAIFQIDTNSGLASPNFNKFAKFSLIYFILSLCSTAISTILIFYRIISVSKENGFNLIGPYRKILEVIVESAALYSVALIIYLPFLVKDDFSDGYPQALLISITGIAPTIITARVSLGVARDYSTARTVDSCEFAAATITVTKSTSKTMLNESINGSGPLSLGREEKLDSDSV